MGVQKEAEASPKKWHLKQVEKDKEESPSYLWPSQLHRKQGFLLGDPTAEEGGTIKAGVLD